MAHLFTHQRQADIFTVFITVTNNHAAGHAGVRQYRHQLGLRAGFQTQRFAGVDQRFNHAAMLVNLDGINQKVVTVIAIRLTRPFKGGVN